MKALDNDIYKLMFATLPVGVLLLDGNGLICEWNQWLASKTGITRKKALQQPLESLFPTTKTARFHFAFEQVVVHQHPQILSQILNRYLIPIALPEETWLEGIEYMQQAVSLFPIASDDTVYALVVIIDVTQNYHQRHMLLHVAKRFEKASVHDELTGLYNRRFLWEYLASELPKASREQYAVVCTMYDLDHFKLVNDELGHEAGDEVLLSFVDVLKKTLRAGDKVFRHGGEEFITISSHVKANQAGALATRVCSKMRAKKKHGSVKRVVTCSAGFEIAIPSFSSLMKPEVLVKHADDALYLAKETGRDKACGYDEVKLPSTQEDKTDVVDFNQVKQLVPDAVGLQTKFYTSFIEEVESSEERLKKAFSTQDCEALAALAHPLKTSAKTVGAMPLASHAEKVEVAARAGDAETIEQLEQDFMKLLNQTLYVLKTYLKQA
jgi:diguanylate cyclase (GGDEF)-like protein